MRNMFFKTLLAGVFFSTYYSVRISSFYFTVSDGLFVVAFLGGVMSGVFSDLDFGDAKNHLVLWAIGVFLIVVGLLFSDLVNQPPPSRTLATVSQYLFAYLFLPFLVMSLKSNVHIKKLLMGFAMGLGSVVAIGGCFYICFPSIYARLVEAGIFIMQVRLGSFIGPNGMAKTIAMTMPFILFKFQDGESYKTSLLLFLVFVFGLIGAASIGGVFSTLLGIIMYLILAPNRTSNLPKFISIILITVALFYCLNQSSYFSQSIIRSFRRVSIPISERSLEAAGSSTEKIALAKEAVAKIAISPLIGIGSHQFVEKTNLMEPVHNTYLLLWVEGGLLSFIGILIIVFSAVSYAWRVYRKGKNKQDITCASLVFTTSFVYATNLLTNTNSYSRFEILPVILTMALLARRERQ